MCGHTTLVVCMRICMCGPGAGLTCLHDVTYTKSVCVCVCVCVCVLVSHVCICSSFSLSYSLAILAQGPGVCKTHAMAQWREGPRPTSWSSAARHYPSRAPQENFNSAEQPADQWNNAASSEHSCQQAAQQWKISASRYQVEVPKDKQTHSRPLPLPFTIDALVQGAYYRGRQYLGHGQSKVCYGLTDTLVLKLCQEKSGARAFPRTSG